MPWFVCFEVPPKTAHGVWERVGLSAPAYLTKDEAIQEVRLALLMKGHNNLHPFDVFQYEENQ